MVVGTFFAVAGTAGAARAPQAKGSGHVTHIAAPAGTLYSQNDNDSGNGIVSQNFEASLAAYDAAGADDFTTTGNGWKIKQVTVTGVYFNGYGPATSETVTFYKDAGGLPGAIGKSKTKAGTDSAGSFVIGLGKKGVKLPNGHFWVSVVANMDFSTGGEWGWEARTVQNGSPAAWQNPGGGFGIGCTTWANMQSCIGISGAPDFMFALSGKQL
jgi:hypothetical protein